MELLPSKTVRFRTRPSNRTPQSRVTVVRTPIAACTVGSVSPGPCTTNTPPPPTPTYGRTVRPASCACRLSSGNTNEKRVSNCERYVRSPTPGSSRRKRASGTSRRPAARGCAGQDRGDLDRIGLVNDPDRPGSHRASAARVISRSARAGSPHGSSPPCRTARAAGTPLAPGARGRIRRWQASRFARSARSHRHHRN